MGVTLVTRKQPSLSEQSDSSQIPWERPIVRVRAFSSPFEALGCARVRIERSSTRDYANKLDLLRIVRHETKVVKPETVLLLLTTSGIAFGACGRRDVPPAPIAVNRSGLDARLRFLAEEEEPAPEVPRPQAVSISHEVGGSSGAAAVDVPLEENGPD
jgi:hypothetical protein